MYALSTSAMNHREFFMARYGKAPVFHKEIDKKYAGTIAPGASMDEMARQILTDLDIYGAYGVRGGKDGIPLIINRADPITPRRITYTPEDGKLVVERVQFSAHSFLERMHRKRGYGTAFLVDDLWAFTVDLVIAAMLFWVVSGVWIWWGMKSTRRWGLVFTVSGIALFTLFILTI